MYMYEVEFSNPQALNRMLTIGQLQKPIAADMVTLLHAPLSYGYLSVVILPPADLCRWWGSA